MSVKIGLVGTGTVGGGCLDIIQNHREDFKRHYGIDIELKRVCSLNSAEAEAHGGMVSLKDGLKQFDDEGITKITDFLDSDIVQASDNFEAVKRAGESYDNFSGITEGTAGSVKFVIETDAIE